MSIGTQRLITPEATAEKIGVRANTLNVWRCTGRYELPYVKVGRKVMYDEADVSRFIEARKVR